MIYLADEGENFAAALSGIRVCTILTLEFSLGGKRKIYKRPTLHEETDSSQLFIHIMS
jgi:hypothetical protein